MLRELQVSINLYMISFVLEANHSCLRDGCWKCSVEFHFVAAFLTFVGIVRCRNNCLLFCWIKFLLTWYFGMMIDPRCSQSTLPSLRSLFVSSSVLQDEQLTARSFIRVLSSSSDPRGQERSEQAWLQLARVLVKYLIRNQAGQVTNDQRDYQSKRVVPQVRYTIQIEVRGLVHRAKNWSEIIRNSDSDKTWKFLESFKRIFYDDLCVNLLSRHRRMSNFD